MCVKIDLKIASLLKTLPFMEVLLDFHIFSNITTSIIEQVNSIITT
jgi:hypothetical protein